MLYGALEAGGTKMVLAVIEENGDIICRKEIETDEPIITVPQIISFFREYEIQSLGIGAFGPVNLKHGTDDYGMILDTPKEKWKYYPLRKNLEQSLQVPVYVDTDVNCSCLGEISFGDAKNLDTVIYLTIGTGIGAGIYINGKLHHGMLHSEAGHMFVKKHINDRYNGSCPYHRDCLEGLASGTAIEFRWGLKAKELEEKKEVWDLEAYYIAQAIVNFIVTLSPQKIILGGGVLKQKQLLPLIHHNVKNLLNGYINTEELKNIENYIVLSKLNDNQGILGCFILASRYI